VYWCDAGIGRTGVKRPVVDDLVVVQLVFVNRVLAAPQIQILIIAAEVLAERIEVVFTAAAFEIEVASDTTAQVAILVQFRGINGDGLFCGRPQEIQTDGAGNLHGVIALRCEHPEAPMSIGTAIIIILVFMSSS